MVEGPPPQPDTDAPLLQAVGVTKRFGGVVANDAIDLDLWPAQIHALLGENGAGKSTLVKMIYGLLTPTAGGFLWQGRPMELASPAQARALGIGMVFQHFSQFDNLTVAENIALGLNAGDSVAAVAARVGEMSRAYGLPLEPRRQVWRLSVGERQRIEIVRCLLQNPKLLILDEPTAVLTPQEAEQLFGTLRKLKKEGRAVLYISHKLGEVRALCDSATILRAGRKVATCDPRQETARSLARMMVGGEVNAVRSEPRTRTGVPRLVVSSLSTSATDPHGVPLDAVTLDVRGGEIVGIAGVAGNGQDELFAALSGERPTGPAAIRIEERAVGRLSITGRRRLGAAFVPDERIGHATAPDLRLSENVLITAHAASGMARGGVIDRAAARRWLDRTVRAFDVRRNGSDPEARSLSGGNLQKFVVGRDLLRQPGILVVNQPTWGVDVGATTTIRQALVNLAAEGAAVLVISQDLDELFEISDRLAVIFRGRVSPAVATRTVSREQIGLLMAGIEPATVEPADARRA